MMNKVTLGEPWELERPKNQFRPLGTLPEPMEFLSRSWSISALEISKVLAPPTQMIKKDMTDVSQAGGDSVKEDVISNTFAGNQYSFADTETTKLIIERIMLQSQEVSPRTSERLSHSSGALSGFLTDSPSVSPPEIEDPKYYSSNNFTNTQFRATTPGGGKTVGRWLKEKKKKKKEASRAYNAQIHASISIAGVAAAIASITAATASVPQRDDQIAKTNVAVASAAALIAAQCVESAESLGAERSYLASIVGSAVNVRSAGDIMTLTAAATTALRGAATLKVRALKNDVLGIGVAERGVGYGGNGSNGSGELAPDDTFTDICSQKLLAKGSELLKRTRKGDLHCKIVSVYINRMGQVMLKMKSRRIGGTITSKKKNIVLEVCKDGPSWPGRHLVDGGENRRYFGLKTVNRGMVEFECINQREHDIWVHGVQRLLAIVRERILRGKGF